MNLLPVKMLGATVYDFTTAVGWNDQQTNITFKLVEDPAANDLYLLNRHEIDNQQGQLIGTPTSFTYGAFRFDGIILGSRELNSIQGMPTYELTMTSPMEILRGVKVILSSYVGPINDSVFNSAANPQYTVELVNLLNVYGYLEDGGDNFGNSEINETGLLWTGPQGVMQAIQTLTNSAYGNNINKRFGSYIWYRGHKYHIDLSGLPVPPDFYRIGGNVYMSLLDIISQIAQDGGVDYLVKLRLGSGNGPHTISFKCVNHVTQLTLGQLSNFIAGKLGSIESNNIGMELRNDITQSFVIGGEINVLQTLENNSKPYIVPFWGFDSNGFPITGQKPDTTFFADDNHAMTFNASPIADLTASLGLGLGYPSEILELRYALINYDSWAAYLLKYKNNLALTLGINGAVNVDVDDTSTFAHDYVADDIDTALSLSNMNNNGQWTSVSQRLYSFVRSQAETYYGKKFLVIIPFRLSVKVVPNTTNVVYSDELADAGYLPEGILPLGLNYVNENFFLDQTGRFYPFLRFQYNANFASVGTLTENYAYKLPQLQTDPLTGDQSYVPMDAGYNGQRVVTADQSILDKNYIGQPGNDPTLNYIYTRCDQGEPGPILQNGALGGGNILFITQNGVVYPAIICSIPNAIFTQAEDVIGGINDIAATLGSTYEAVYNASDIRNESFPLKIHPPAIYPNGVAIALKSNQYTYGPWGKYTADGQVEVEYDPSMTPWEYGSYQQMNMAAVAKMANIATGNQVLEKGGWTDPGEPQFDLLDYITDGGPVLTRIDVTNGIEGIKTTYTMETFVPRAGVFTRQNADRLKQYGKNLQQLRSLIRQSILATNDNNKILANAYNGFMYGTSYAVKQETPHNVMLGYAFKETDGTVTPLIYTNTYRESVGNVGANSNAKYVSTACASMETLFRPYSTNFDPVGNISHFASGDAAIVSNSISVANLNPVQLNSDFIWFSSGSGYQQMNQRKKPGVIEDARLIALRGPLVMSGWGFDYAGNPIPNMAASGNDPIQNFTSSPTEDYLVKSDLWPAGPVDLRWDKWRGVWSFPTFITATYSGGFAVMNKDHIPVEDPFGPTADNTPCFVGYFPLENKWKVIQSKCNQ